MANYFCVVHKDEDQQSLKGESLHMCSHMVIHTGYDLSLMRNLLLPHQVIWVMERDASDKYGYRFKELVGIPH